jgi:hypothetical protein
MGEESMRLRDTPSPTPSLATPHFGFGSRVANKESLPTLAPESPRTKSRRATHVVPVLSVATHTGLSTMCALLILACCLAAWPIHLCITRPVARMLGLIP